MINPQLEVDQALSHMGHSLARARILKEITQEELAQVCGVSRRTIQQMELGRNVAVSTWMVAASHLGYLSDLVSVMKETKPLTMDQFQSIASGTHEQRKRVRR